MRTKAIRRRLLSSGALLVVLFVVFQGSAQAVYSPYPGLPVPSIEQGGWYWVQQTGMSETTKADQWVRVPPLTLASWGGIVPTGTSQPGEPRHYRSAGDAAFVSPPGAPQPYGYMPPLRVRTAGFGMLPVEATIQISQRRHVGPDGHNRPIPVHADMTSTGYPDGHTVNDDTVIEDAFNVRVTKVKVDGVDVRLTGNCRTIRPAPVHMVGPGYTIPPEHAGDVLWFLAMGEDNYFNPIYGGTLTGTITIPPFTGCTTKTGDDLSPLLTLSASGPGNKVTARARFCSKETGQIGAPPAPGDWDKFPFPEPGGQPSYYALCNPFDHPDELDPYPQRLE